MLKDIYVTRDCEVNSVDLVALPHGSVLLGGGHFVLAAGGNLISEQYPVYLKQSLEQMSAVTSSTRPVEEVGNEALLIARYGIFTWGHWLGELLPKAVVAERFFPGRFTYVMPYQTIGDTSPNLPWTRIRESLAAYGIDQERLTLIREDRDYRFKSLFAVTPVWSDSVIHPEVVSVLREDLRIGCESTPRGHIAIGRLPAYGRGLENFGPVQHLLRAAGFSVQQTGAMSFVEQVSVFSKADVLFGILGSDLTNLIYAPPGIKVITVAPANFGDRFFYALVLASMGKQIDLRGQICVRDAAIAHKSMFRIDLEEVERAIRMFVR